jgi:N-acetylneuraminate synthase
VLLKCTSTYPATPQNTNVATIPHMRQLFNCEIGLSDHTMGIGASVAAVALGGTVIEKHFTLRRADGGPDSAFSLEPDEFKTLVEDCKRAWKALGKATYDLQGCERGSMVFRRSIYVVRDIAAGEELTRENIRSIRPGYGLPPKHLPEVLGRHAARDLKRGEPLGWPSIR